MQLSATSGLALRCLLMALGKDGVHIIAMAKPRR